MSTSTSRNSVGKRLAGYTARAISLGVFGAMTMLAGPASSETLLDALTLAYTSNPRLLAQRAQLRGVDEQVPQALSGYRPTANITLEAGKTNTRSQGATSSTKANLSPRTASVSVSQPIFRGFRTLFDTRRAKAAIMQERARLVLIEQDVLFDTVSAYMNVVRDQAVLELNVKNAQVLRRQLQATRDRFQVGEVTRTDVSQAEARVAQARATRVQAEGTLQISRANYRRVVGQLPAKLKSPTKKVRIPVSQKIVVENASRGAPSLIVARFAETAARHNVDLIAGELLPTVTLNASLSRSVGSSSRKNRTSTGRFTAHLVIPLYQAGLTSSRIRQAKQTVSQRYQEIIDARRTAIEAATQAWHNLQTARAQVRAFTAAVKANTIALDGVRQEAAAGLRTVLDVLDAEQELLDSRVNLVRAQRDVVVTSYNVWRSMGVLTAGNLKLPVQIYDATRHFRRIKYLPWGIGGRTSSYAK